MLFSSIRQSGLPLDEPQTVDLPVLSADHDDAPLIPAGGDLSLRLEKRFDAVFTARLAVREKQVQQSYRPIIGVHKWFARRPGTVFRNLLLAEFNGAEPADHSYWQTHQFSGVIADPFMGGGTPLYEANRLGFGVVGSDINPMAYWVVRQSLGPFDPEAFTLAADRITAEVESSVGPLYRTECQGCGGEADVKYFLWVKTANCPACATENDLFPGYLVAEATRHPNHVLVCGTCGELNEYDHQPTVDSPLPCRSCDAPVSVEGPARRNRITCWSCHTGFGYPTTGGDTPPHHRLFALEYHCARCKPTHKGRFLKKATADDLALVSRAEHALACLDASLPIPADAIPPGDETDRLRRWGYRHYREMFGGRQLLGLGLLLRRISEEPDEAARHALLTVFSDFLRYQNMLCRYDTYALKCQDIFSVHGFPVGLVQCENNLLGIDRVGSGSFRHFVEKYKRAKAYCAHPFETRYRGGRKQVVPIVGETIRAEAVDRLPAGPDQAWLNSSPAAEVPLPVGSLDGVFTDPPYYDNVQYAELMDFCYVWLRQALAKEFQAFRAPSTRAAEELTGNDTLGRGIAHFTEGMSEVFRHYATALKPGAPFVFTYHHNRAEAYVPLVVAILDAGLDCSATLPAPAEMGASLHIAGTNSSVLDSVFVCRRGEIALDYRALDDAVDMDVTAMQEAGLRVTAGDLRCLRAGHVARLATNRLRADWDASADLEVKVSRASVAVACEDAGTSGHVMRRLIEESVGATSV